MDNKIFDCLVIDANDEEHEMTLTSEDFNGGALLIRNIIANHLKKEASEVELERFDIMFKIQVKKPVAPNSELK